MSARVDGSRNIHYTGTVRGRAVVRIRNYCI